MRLEALWPNCPTPLEFRSRRVRGQSNEHSLQQRSARQRRRICALPRCASLTSDSVSCCVTPLPGSRSFLLPHATTSDSDLFSQILAIDRGETVAGAVEGVLPDATAAEAAAAAATPAEPAAAKKAASA